MLLRYQSISKAYTKYNPTKRYFSETSSSIKEGVGSNISSFFHRVSSFLVGTAVGFGANFYLIHEELIESNKKFQNTLCSLEDRIGKLENKSK